MKIVSWNCNGVLRKKFKHISSFNADIYVIQECEDPSKTSDKAYEQWCKNHLWIGDSKNKGLGIFARPSINLELLNWSDLYRDHSVKYFLPCAVNNSFQRLGVWTHRNNSPNFGIWDNSGNTCESM